MQTRHLYMDPDRDPLLEKVPELAFTISFDNKMYIVTAERF